MTNNSSISTSVMTVDEWIAVKDNPIQRDTERHAAKAKHLLNPIPAHGVVHAAKLPSGQLVKLDGHTRALLWKRNIVARPKKIEVVEYPVDNLEAAAELYKTFDSKDALETTPDKVSGALKGMGYPAQSPLVASGALAHALRLAWVGQYGYARERAPRDIYEVITEFSAEIIALDDLGLRKGQLPGGAVAAVLLSYRKHGDAVTPFWQGVVGAGGTKSAGRMDGIQAVNEIILSRRTNAGHSAALDTLGRCLTAVEKYIEGDTFASNVLPRSMDVTSYLTAKTTKPKYKLIKKVKRPVHANGNGAVHADA